MFTTAFTGGAGAWNDGGERWNLLRVKIRTIAYKLENCMIRLIRNLQIKRESGDWNDSFIVRDCNEAYQAENTVAHDR